MLVGQRLETGGKQAVFVERIRPDGSEAWSAQYFNGLAFAFTPHGIVRQNGTLYVVASDSATPRNLYTLAYSESGQALWSRRIAANVIGGATEGAVKVAVSANGILMATELEDGSGRVAVVRQPFSNVVPSVEHLSPFLGLDLTLEGLTSVADDAIVAVRETAFGGSDLIVARMTPAGNLAWSQTFWRPVDRLKEAVALVPAGDGTVAVVARFTSGNESAQFAARIAGNGILIWQRYLAPVPENFPTGAGVIGTNLFVPGFSRATPQSSPEIYVNRFALANGFSTRTVAPFSLLFPTHAAFQRELMALGTRAAVQPNRPQVSLWSGLGVIWSIAIADGAGISADDFKVAIDNHDAIIGFGRRGTGPGGEGFAFRVSQPVPVKSVTVTPTSVAGGATFSGTVSLERAAPPIGTSIALSRSIPAVNVPATVTVPGGATQINFSGTTVPVSTTVSATITASSGTSSRQATIEVRAPELESVSVLESPLPGGENAVGRVRMTSNVTADTTVSLSDNSTFVSIPASVVIRRNTREANFAVTTSGVLANAVVRLTATQNRITRTFDLTLTPPRIVSVVVPTLESTRSGNTVVTWRGVPRVQSTIQVAYVGLTGPASVTVPANARSVSIPVTAAVRVAPFVTSVTASAIFGTLQGQGDGRPVPVTSMSTAGLVREDTPFELRFNLLANVPIGSQVRLLVTKVSGPGTAFLNGLPLTSNAQSVILPVAAPFANRVRGQLRITEKGTTVIRATVLGQLSSAAQISIEIP